MSKKTIVFLVLAAGLAGMFIFGSVNQPASVPTTPNQSTEGSSTTGNGNQNPASKAASASQAPVKPIAISYSSALQKLNSGEFVSVKLQVQADGRVMALMQSESGLLFSTLLVQDDDLPAEFRFGLNANHVTYDLTPYTPSFFDTLMSWLPTLLIIGVMFFIFRSMSNAARGGGGGMGNFTKSPSKETMEIPTITLADVGGINHIRKDLEDVVEKILGSSELGYLGGTVPRGFLFVGPPGTGKTLIAQALAGEVNRRRGTSGKPVGFKAVAASEFVEMYVGVGAARVRSLFAEARKSSPCIIFIDEIDALGKRDSGGKFSGGNDERVSTLNQILVEMNGFSSTDQVLVIAATNRVDMLDDALLRPGRFDRKVSIPLPDLNGREEILNIHAKGLCKSAVMTEMKKQRLHQLREAGGKLPAQLQRKTKNKTMEDYLSKVFAPDVDFNQLAREMPGASGADLAEVLKRAASIAESKRASRISIADIREAYQSLKMGDAMPRELAFSDTFAVAVHEIVGHGVVGGYMCKKLGPDHTYSVQTLTIVPRGSSLGAVWFAPNKDEVSQSKKFLLSRIAISAAGHIAEKLYLGADVVSSGASSDIQQATQIASNMVLHYAMSDNQDLTFRSYREDNGFAATKAREEMVDMEIDTIIKTQYRRALGIMLLFAGKKTAHGQNLLEYLTRAMIAKKTLQGEEFMRILDGEEVFGSTIDLGDNEQEFVTLWNAHAADRQTQLAEFQAAHADVVAELAI